MFKWGWTKLDAKLVDQKFVRRFETSARSNVHIQEWDHMVELPAGVEGPAKRLVIREKSYKLDAKAKARKQRDEERFRAKLEE